MVMSKQRNAFDVLNESREQDSRSITRFINSNNPVTAIGQVLAGHVTYSTFQRASEKASENQHGLDQVFLIDISAILMESESDLDLPAAPDGHHYVMADWRNEETGELEGGLVLMKDRPRPYPGDTMLRDHREKHRLSLNTVASHFGMTAAELSAIEYGSSPRFGEPLRSQVFQWIADNGRNQ